MSEESIKVKRIRHPSGDEYLRAMKNQDGFNVPYNVWQKYTTLQMTGITLELEMDDLAEEQGYV